MRWKSTAVAMPWLCLLCLFLGYGNVSAQAPISGFGSALVSNQWNEAVGLTFTRDGLDMFVWERGGRLHSVRNGTKRLVLDLSQEVGGWHDHGMLGFALHPHFDENGYIYLLYVVDRHHLMFFGKGGYNPNTSDYFKATIGRLARYTLTNNGSGTYTADPASRKILLGETKKTGIPIVSLTHGVGSLIFGTDETLLVSTGDGASPSNYDRGSYSDSYFAQALQDSIITDTENVGALRSQLLDCLNGKILRIDPETGHGLPSNPFYDPTRPDRTVSKVWALGLRNPFRMLLEPGTGSHVPEDGNPGTLYFGDVGWITWEELSKVDGPGQNFGWPIYEGLEASGYASVPIANKEAPNPLYQVGGCNQQFFNFQDLIKQETASGTSSFPNPCNAAQQIPSTIPTFVHKRPLIDWRHGSGPSRTGIFNGQSAAVVNIGAAGSPVAGPQFGGSSATGGVFYTGTDFPPEFQNTMFFGDYSGGWIRNLSLNENRQPVEVRNFVNSNAIVVHMTTHPTGEGLYYVNFPSEIRRITYTSNRLPVAIASVDQRFGASPLTVQFTSSGSTDPEDQPLTYEWNFGDGSPLSNEANPSHTFIKGDGMPGMFTVTLKVRDPLGAEDITTLTISINNTPPDVVITSPLNNTFYPLTGETPYDLRATVTDSEHTAGELTYAWLTTMHHESHQHPEPVDNQPETSTSLAPVGCDGETYFYSITLTVTDAVGASTTKEVRLYPDCSGVVKVNPVITWANPAAIALGTALGVTQLNAIASYNDVPLAGAYLYTPPAGTELSMGTNQTLSVTFTPNNSVLYNQVTKTVAIDVTKANPVINWTNPFPIVVGTPLSTTQLNATATHNGNPVPGTFVYTPPAGTVLALGTGQQLSVTFTPTDTDTYNTATKTVTIDVNATAASLFYRAININGPALTIDGNNWISSTGAPNFSFSTNNTVMTNQGITLVPATDANRATMIRSSVYGNTVTLNMTAVPTGSYQVWLYVWEDNNPEIFSISLEGSVVLSNYNSGSAGTWRKLGPYPVNITDGAINVTSSGGHANISGLEVWTGGPPPGNQPPVVANPIPNQTASAGVAFSYAFPSNTFSDPNAGTTLTYTATLDGGGSLPAWLTFTGSTRTFSGTPALANLGTINIRVTASDGAGGTVSDVFALTVGEVVKVTPVINWSNPSPIALGTALSATQLNATATHNGSPVAGSFVYTPPAGTVLSLGTGQQLSVTFTPTNTTLYNGASKTVTIDVNETVQSTFYRAINLNGAALTIDGNNWISSTGAPNFSFTTTNGASSKQSVTLIPSTDANRATMIRSYVWGSAVTLNMTAVPSGNYQVWVYVWEDNNPETYSISLEGSVVQSNYNSGPMGTWRKLGPYPVNITDGAINVSSAGGHVNFSGIEVWTLGSPPANQPPIVANPIPNQNATAGVSFSYAFPSNTFSDPNAGTTLTYTATLEGGGALPGWLTFTGSTRIFSGTPAPANLGSINIQVTASDGAGGTVSDVFTLTVGEAVKVTPVINWSNPSPIAVGTALGAAQLNATATHNGSPVAGSFVYTPPAGTMLSLGTGQQLSVTFTPTNTTLYNAASKTVAIDVVDSPPSTFYRAINLNGAALTIDGNSWISSTGAPNFSFTTNRSVSAKQSIILIPPTDANRATMIRSYVWGTSVTLNMTAVPSGNYQVYLYVWEDNNPETYSISLEGSVVVSNFNSGATGSWTKLGPFPVNITDGAINVSSAGGYVNFSGIEVWTGTSDAAARTSANARTAALEEVTNNGALLEANPNPFSTKLHVRFTAQESSNARVELFDLRGRVVYLLYSGKMLAGETKENELEPSELPDGIYILQFVNGKHVARLKLMGVR